VAAALSGVPLTEASRAADDGRVVTAHGEPFRWQAFPQVLPVSERLKERVYGEHYEVRVAEAQSGSTSASSEARTGTIRYHEGTSLTGRRRGQRWRPRFDMP